MFNLIGILIYILPIVALLTATIFAFLAQKNWATITLLVSLSILIMSMVLAIYGSALMMKEYRASSNNYAQSETYSPIFLFAEILAVMSPFLFVTGLLGFMRTSRSIYSKQETLERENNQLSIKLNQL